MRRIRGLEPVGKAQSRSAACELYRRGAAKGDVISMLRFADSYEWGVSVKRDSVAAEMLREKALREGNPAEILLDNVEGERGKDKRDQSQPVIFPRQGRRGRSRLCTGRPGKPRQGVR